MLPFLAAGKLIGSATHDSVLQPGAQILGAKPLRYTTRPLSGMTGRLLPGKIVVNWSTCNRWIGTVFVITIHCTPPVQGGVVNEPS